MARRQSYGFCYTALFVQFTLEALRADIQPSQELNDSNCRDKSPEHLRLPLRIMYENISLFDTLTMR